MKKEYSDYPEESGDVRAVNGIKGPLAYAEVLIGGTQVEAMLDTGSSVCIISQDLFLKVGKAAGIPTSALQKPDLPLRDYSHNTILVIASVNLEVEAKGNVIKETLYILPGAEPSCLLGLNTVCRLGLVCLAPEVKLQQDDASEEQAEKEDKSETAVVRLIKAERIPQKHGALLHVTIQGHFCESNPLLFVPNNKWMEETGLDVERHSSIS